MTGDPGERRRSGPGRRRRPGGSPPEGDASPLPAGAAAAEPAAGRERSILVAAATATAAIAWLYLAGHQTGAGHPLLAPHAQPPGSGGFLAAVAMWQVMMIAMMLPSVLPWVLLSGKLGPEHSGASPYVSAARFAAGYFTVWLAYSLVAAAVQGELARRALFSVDLRLSTGVGGLLLIVAGLFQLTPAKNACLTHCRNPLSFLLGRWRESGPSPLALGVRHGLYCLGCCWALMAVAFALGLMNLLWMTALTLLLCVEKLAPRGRLVGRAFGAALAVWGAWLIAGTLVGA